MIPLIMIGSGGHARVLADLIAQQGQYQLVGVVDDFRQPGEQVFGTQVLGGMDAFIAGQLVAEQPLALVVAIGDNFQRLRLAKLLQPLVNTGKAEFATLVHPAACVSPSVNLQPGCQVLAGAILAPNVTLAPQVIVNHRASVDHDCSLAEGSSLAPGAVLAGNVTLDCGAAVGMGALVREKCHIGDHALVAAGSLVLDNVAGETLVMGTPARVIRMREPGEKYLR